jgi:HPt (histidine-containing phosphotransfer) domain-containing protein
LVAEMIDAFVTDAGRRLHLIRTAMLNSDVRALQHQVHAIKGSSKQMEAWQVASLCEQIEAACLELSIEQSCAMAKTLETQVQDVCAAMTSFLTPNR